VGNLVELGGIFRIYLSQPATPGLVSNFLEFFHRIYVENPAIAPGQARAGSFGYFFLLPGALIKRLRYRA